MNNNKTCGECKHYDMHGGCNKILNTLWIHSTNIACIKFEAKNPTNGDRIRQMSNEGIAAFVCGLLNDRREETFRSVLDLLNAPSDCVAKNGKSAKQADLCCKSAKESEAREYWNRHPAEDALKAEIARYRRALYNLKEDCTRRKHFALSDEEKMFLTEEILHIEAELDYAPATAEKWGGDDE